MKAPDAAGGSSPYSTGGGGVTFERKVAVQYLAHLLVGDGAVELGDGRLVVGVDFQQVPDHSADDLVIHAARAGEPEPSLVLAVGVRRSPNLVPGDELARKLIRAFVHEVAGAPAGGRSVAAPWPSRASGPTPGSWRSSLTIPSGRRTLPPSSS